MNSIEETEYRKRITDAYMNRHKARKKTEIKREKILNTKKGFEIIIDGVKHKISSQFVNGKQIKLLAGITEKDEQLAKVEYHEYCDMMGWFAYCSTINDEPMLDSMELDIIEHGNKFYTTCNGLHIIKNNKK